MRQLRTLPQRLVLLVGSFFALSLSWTVGQDSDPPPAHPRVVKRTALIERGREIIMEEVVFDHPSSKGAPEVEPVPVVAPDKMPEHHPGRAPLEERSFVVHPATGPDGRSLVTWWSTSEKAGMQRHRCWSNLDWSLFGTGVSFVADGTRYRLICLPGSLDPDRVDSDTRPPSSLRAAAESAPAYHLLPPLGAERYPPDPAARLFMRALHRHVASHQAELRIHREERKRVGQARQARLEAEKRQPKDLVIRYGIKPQPVEAGERAANSNR